VVPLTDYYQVDKLDVPYKSVDRRGDVWGGERKALGRGAARAKHYQGTPTQSHISPSILVYADNLPASKRPG